MLGPGEIDSLEAAFHVYSLAGDAHRASSVRRFAERLAREPFDALAIHGIDAGETLALATRFDCAWAYRGRQALLWRASFRAHEVHDRFLPTPLLRPFDRRGFLEVRGHVLRPLALVAAELSRDRNSARELRFVRNALRMLRGDAVLFLANVDERTERIGVRDLGFTTVDCREGRAIYRRTE